jgi:predicted enzyme related to lactoylglutathione lyase
MTKHGHFHWNELMVHDAERAKKFYAETIGWTFTSVPIPSGTYWLAKDPNAPNENAIAGIFTMTEARFEKMPEQWVGYIAVDDIDARLKKATAAGAKIYNGPVDMPGVGRFAFIGEPGGAMVGWITPAN